MVSHKIVLYGLVWSSNMYVVQLMHFSIYYTVLAVKLRNPRLSCIVEQ